MPCSFVYGILKLKKFTDITGETQSKGVIMKFLVCVKQVVDTSKMEVDETGRLKRASGNSMLNPMDRNALEGAFALRDQEGGTVTVIAMGPPQAEMVLKEAISMGADEAYLVTDRAFGGADTLATSYTLGKAIQKIGPFDLIFCGQESLDSNTAQVGPELAATLGIPDVSAAIDISFEREGYVTVTRQMGDEISEVVEMKLPGLVTCTPYLNRPRYPSIKGILRKFDINIQHITSSDMDVDPSRIGLTGSPTQVLKVRPIEVPKKENLKIEGKTASEAVDELFAGLVKLKLV